jgi:hypothetical protein
LENKLRTIKDNIVISDCRFPNEIKSIRRSGGIVVRVKRGAEPNWYQDAVNFNEGDRNMLFATSRSKLERAGIHASETAWVGTDFDHILDNNGSIDDLYTQVKSLVQCHPASTASPV